MDINYLITSKFIKKKLKKMSFENIESVEYILALVELEKYILGFSKTSYDSMGILLLKNRYELEYGNILKELDPKKYENEFMQDDVYVEYLNKVDKILLEREQLKKWWELNGGSFTLKNPDERKKFSMSEIYVLYSQFREGYKVIFYLRGINPLILSSITIKRIMNKKQEKEFFSEMTLFKEIILGAVNNAKRDSV